MTKVLGGIRTQNFREGVYLVDDCLNQKIEFQPNLVLADYYESVESMFY